MDARLRRLERQAATGEYDARQQWKHALSLAGHPDPDLEELTARLTEAEEVQQDYDDLWWHAKGPMYWSWGGSCWCCSDWSKWSAKLSQDHHTWGHRGWNNRNSKRKTLRTHRDGSSSKNYKRSQKRQRKEHLEPHEERRMKRFGGRERLYGQVRSWEWDENWKLVGIVSVYYYRVPGSDV